MHWCSLVLLHVLGFCDCIIRIDHAVVRGTCWSHSGHLRQYTWLEFVLQVEMDTQPSMGMDLQKHWTVESQRTRGKRSRK